MSVLSKVTIGITGLAALGIAGYAVAFVPSPLGTGIAPLTTIVAPDTVTRSIICSGDVVGHVGDSASISGVAATTRMMTSGNETVDLAMDNTTNGSVVTHTGDSMLVAASEYAAVHNDSISGYLATECGDPLNEQWLVGGSTTTGRDSILTISNGSDVESRIDLDIWGASGQVDAPGSKGIVIPARSQRSYSVAGFAPDEASPVVRVVSNGAAVWATLQTTDVRGLVPGGLDRVGPVAEPTTAVAFPNLHIGSEASIGAVLADSAYSDITPALRFLAPGDTDATVSITLDPYAKGDTNVVTATIPHGSTLDIPLAEVSEGDWSITITSDQPIVAAARVGFHDVKSGITDIAWASAAPAQIGTATVFVPGGSSLGLVNPTASDADVMVGSGDVVVTVTVPAHGSLFVPVNVGLVTIKSTTDIANAVFISTKDGIATLRGLTAPIDAANVVVTSG